MRLRQQTILGDIEFDTSEKDCILLWQKQQEESNVIFIDRSKLNELIQILNAQVV